MNNEQKILSTLELILEKLEDHSGRFETIDIKLKEHNELLSALRTGQDYLKAEIDGMKISNAKEFGEIKKQMEEYSLNFGLLRDDVWEQKVHIERIKKTMGMA